MYHQCTTEKTATQQKIFTEALYQAMQEKSYSEITITELCFQTGLSRNIFYRLFDCKDDILYALIDNRFLTCTNNIHNTTPSENLRSFYQYWKDQKPFLDTLKRNRLESYLSIRGALCCCQADFGMQKMIDNKWRNYETEILCFYSNGFIGLLIQWYNSNYARSIEEMVEITHPFIGHPPIQTK